MEPHADTVSADRRTGLPSIRFEQSLDRTVDLATGGAGAEQSNGLPIEAEVGAVNPFQLDGFPTWSNRDKFAEWPFRYVT